MGGAQGKPMSQNRVKGTRSWRFGCGALVRLRGVVVGASGFDALEDLHALVMRTIADEPPVQLADGRSDPRRREDAELDELRALSSSGRQSVAAIEERERQRTGIGSLR